MNILESVRLVSLDDEIDNNRLDYVIFNDVDKNLIESEVNKELSSSKNPFEDINNYTEDFDISDEYLRNRIKMNALGNTFEEKTKNFLEDLIRIKIECIYKAKKSDMELKNYQRKAVEFMLVNRGMVAAFEMGSGKTLTAVAIANCIIQIAIYLGLGDELRVIIVTSPTLKANFIKEMKAYGINPKFAYYLDFYTPQILANNIKNEIIDCQKSFVIIDEAHNMRTDYNGNFAVKKIAEDDLKHMTRAETAVICSSEAWKVLLLTGTPFYNSSVDIINLAAMVKGEEYPSNEDPYKLMKENPKKFKEYYRDIFMFHQNDEEYFPKRKDYIFNIVMDKKTLDQYEDIESSLSTEAPIKKRGRGRPSYLDMEMNQDEVEEIKRDGRGKNGYMAALRTSVNTIQPCLKCKYLIRITKDALSRNEKVLIFSEFKETGSEEIGAALRSNRIDHIILDGSVKVEERSYLIELYNIDKIKVLVITRAGGEGIDLKRTRHIIAYEKNWNIATMEQYIGRGIRYKSHADLEWKDRTVTVWHLMLIKPNEYKNVPEEVEKYAENLYYNATPQNLSLKVRNRDKMSVDLYMFTKALEKQKKIDEVKNELMKIEIGSTI